MEKRCRNFSEFEKQLPVVMALQYPEIECKTIDKMSKEAKKMAWETPTEKFVSVSGIKRDALQLKTVRVTFFIMILFP